MTTRPRYLAACVHSLLIAGSLSLVSHTALAANEEAAQSEDERLLVTGSRIRQSQAEGVAPLQVLDREDLERTGLTSIGDILNQLSSSGSAINTRFNSSGNFGFPPDGGGIGAGAVEVDLRHLGSNRVLVLVDGQRWVKGSSASGVANSTDLNTIPMSIVERIEIYEDGASTIYGSDAIAGVVNIITRKDFDGVEASVYGAQFDEGDGETMAANLSFGTVGQRSSTFIDISHTDQDEVSAAHRSLARFPVPGTGVTRGSSGTPQGRFVFCAQDTDMDGVCDDEDVVSLTINDGVTGIPVYNAASPGTGDDFHAFTNEDRFNFSPFNLYVTPNQRTSIYGQTRYELTDGVELYAKVLFNNRKSVNQAAPEPIFIGPDAGTGGLADTIGIDATNPYNPFGFTLDESNFVFAGRRPLEGGPRVFRQNVDTTFITTGVTGSFDWGERYFDWSANLAWGKNRADQIKTGGYNARNIKNALGPVDACNADPACVPLNLTGGQGDGSGTITQEMLNYIQFTQKDVSENQIRMASWNISGDLFELPAGWVAVAFGGEYREEEGFFQPDAVVVAGDSNGIPAQPTSGGFDVDEHYVEFQIPLLKDTAFAEYLDITAAARHSDYDTSGSELTSKFGIRWRPMEELMFRATMAEGFRAPGIGELFATGTRFDAQLTDPCSNNGSSPNCQALGVPAGYEQFNPQISVTTGGNPNLEAEKSDSFTAGLVYSPAWVSDQGWGSQANFSLTYYDHEITDAIQAVDAQFQLNQCVANPGSVFCDGITRTAGGSINGFDNRLQNIGEIETSGWDVGLSFVTNDYDWGRLAFSWQNTLVDEYIEDGRKLEGVEANDSGIPEWKSTFITDWAFGDWGFAWTIRHIDELEESCSDFLDGTPNGLAELGLCSDPAARTNTLDATTYHDLRVSWSPGDWDSNVEFSAGVNNVMDEDPPACYSCSLNGYDPSVYDPQGRFGYLKATIRL